MAFTLYAISASREIVMIMNSKNRTQLSIGVDRSEFIKLWKNQLWFLQLQRLTNKIRRFLCSIIKRRNSKIWKFRKMFQPQFVPLRWSSVRLDIKNPHLRISHSEPRAKNKMKNNHQKSFFSTGPKRHTANSNSLLILEKLSFMRDDLKKLVTCWVRWSRSRISNDFDFEFLGHSNRNSSGLPGASLRSGR